ncbi:hypothetical protein [Paenibacillus odorifer]|uniref:hypothetical protein n=1 Tax=Paenibacillus odorifer TaxID=189426 RepID=UPI00096C1868|nr:hypothetical protein [Paenibacillus odorifer]OMD67604.1 hypothetical protein BSK50_29995 [Paenibacillus odorifer]
MSENFILTKDYPNFPMGTMYEKIGEEEFLGRTTHLLKCLSNGNYRIRVTDKELKEEFRIS